jgi:hypothetical protein
LQALNENQLGHGSFSLFEGATVNAAYGARKFRFLNFANGRLRGDRLRPYRPRPESLRLIPPRSRTKIPMGVAVEPITLRNMKKIDFRALTSIGALTLMLTLTGCNSTGRGSSGESDTDSATGMGQADPIFPQSTERLNDKRPDQPSSADTAPVR